MKDNFFEKGQSGFEFMVLVGAVLFLFLGFLFAIQSDIGYKTREKRTNAVKEIAIALQDEVSLAVKSTNGYVRNFEIPLKVEGSIDYEIDIVNNFVYVRTKDGEHALALPVAGRIVGNVVKGNNVIKKINGEIYLN